MNADTRVTFSRGSFGLLVALALVGTAGCEASATTTTTRAQTPVAAASKVEQPFYGLWRLVSFDGKKPDGTPVLPLGPSPIGFLIYAPDGTVAVQASPSARPAFGSDASVASEHEKSEAFSSYISYAGTLTVDPVKRTVSHHVTMALIPNWVGTTVVRDYAFSADGNQLTLSATFPTTGSVTLLWQRASVTK